MATKLRRAGTPRPHGPVTTNASSRAIGRDTDGRDALLDVPTGLRITAAGASVRMPDKTEITGLAYDRLVPTIARPLAGGGAGAAGLRPAVTACHGYLYLG